MTKGLTTADAFTLFPRIKFQCLGIFFSLEEVLLNLTAKYKLLPTEQQSKSSDIFSCGLPCSFGMMK